MVLSVSGNGHSFVNPIALRKAKIVYNFGLSECSGVKVYWYTFMLLSILEGKDLLLREQILAYKC